MKFESLKSKKFEDFAKSQIDFHGLVFGGNVYTSQDIDGRTYWDCADNINCDNRQFTGQDTDSVSQIDRDAGSPDI